MNPPYQEALTTFLQKMKSPKKIFNKFSTGVFRGNFAGKKGKSGKREALPAARAVRGKGFQLRRLISS
jgi:hypothetical protein